MAKTIARFTIMVEGLSRTLIGISERANGDVIVDLKPGQRHRNDPNSGEFHAPINVARYSLHVSPNSANGNLLKQTIKRVGDSDINSWHFTNAIKETGLCAPLYIRRFPDLGYDHFLTPVDGAESISLGSYDPFRFNLVAAVLVCSPSRRFDPRGIGVWSYREFSTAHFKIVVLWSFAIVPSNKSGDAHHIQTKDPAKEENWGRASRDIFTMRGYDEVRAGEYFSGMRDFLIAKYIRRLSAVDPRYSLFFGLPPRYLTTGDPLSQGMLIYLEQLAAAVGRSFEDVVGQMVAITAERRD